jgi:multiple sugar transport system substrate-binding protein
MGVRRTALVSMMVVVTALVGACRGDTPDPKADPTETSGKPVVLRFMAYGPTEEVEAYQSMVDRFNDENEGVSVSLVKVANQDEALSQLRSGDTPDIFLISGRDLAEVADKQLNQPIDELLDSRGVDFSDFYKRDSLQAFGHDQRLQCMPYGISPMVIYFNTALIDFDTMEEQGLPRATTHSTWTFEQFAAAAEFASRKGTKGVHIAPSLLGLAPFVYSGGGDLFDDAKEPTSLALSSEESVNALNTTMEVLRKGRLTPTPRQLREESALDRFKTGKLGMIAGFRNLVPELRKTPSLNFDVMPMPNLGTETTVGDVTGLCMSADAVSPGGAADFIVHAISEESVSQVAKAGYLVPSNNQVAESDAFLQSDQLPAHPEVFNRSVRDIVIPPLTASFPKLEDAVHDQIYQLFYTRVLDMEEQTLAIDETSRTVIAPEEPEED